MDNNILFNWAFDAKTVKPLFDSYISDNFFDYFYNKYGVTYHFLYGEYSYKKFIFQLLSKCYRNDYFIRYSFFVKCLDNKRDVSFFELPLKDSRADIVKIGSKSTIYEIKTEYDSLDRLLKQVNDYSKCFEYVYIICPEKRADKVANIIPNYCGIITYPSKKAIRFNCKKEASISPNISNEYLVDLMLKDELNVYFKTSDKNAIVENNSSDHISNIFKRALKKRFLPKMEQISDVCASLI